MRPSLHREREIPLGHGVLIWFEVDELDAILERVERFAMRVHTRGHKHPSSGARRGLAL
jgi:hypothetical protein